MNSARQAWKRRGTFYDFVYTDAAGTRHPFPIDVYSAPTECGFFPTDQLSADAIDGSGYSVELGETLPQWPCCGILNFHPWVWSRSGFRFDDNGRVTDTNGNFISKSVSGSETTWKDTVGRDALKIVNVSSSRIDYKYLDPTGAYQTIVLTLSPFLMRTNFGCAGVLEYNSGTTSYYLPTSLTFPNGQSFSFEYEETPGFPGKKTGRVSKVILPTGGYYQYSYPAPNNGINCADGTVKNLTRVINDGSASATWTYARTQVGSDWKTTVTPPILPYDTSPNISTFTFNSSGQIIGEKHYQGAELAQNLRRTVNTTYAANGSPSATTVILENNLQSKTETTFDSVGNLTELREYDFGPGFPIGPVRTTQTSFGLSYPIRDRVTQVLFRAGGPASAIKSRTEILYNQVGYINIECPGSVPQYDSGSVLGGNPTTIKSYTDAATPAGLIQQHFYYDCLGNVRKLEANGAQQKEWIYSSAHAHAYPTEIRTGPVGNQLITTATYNTYTGLPASTTDENNKTTSFSYDTMKRLTRVQRPDTQLITATYDDVARTVTTQAPLDGTNLLTSVVHFDPLGRKFKSSTSAPEDASFTEVAFDPLGRAFELTNPYRSGDTKYWTETRFDALGRPLKVIPPDGSPTSNHTAFSYAGTSVTVTDPAGEQRKSETDALGRLVKVYEPDVNNGNALTQLTSYAYNVTDLLTTVTQGVQTRTYVYDDLGRLTSQTTPEAGTWGFLYNALDQLTQRTDARGVITTYGYDTLNRPSTVSYNVGGTGVPNPGTVTYTYGTDPLLNEKGRLKTVTDSSGSETYSYDGLGRITQMQKVITGTTYTLGYGYNLASEPTSITYPSGRVVTQSYDAAGRLSSITSGATQYVNTFSYNAAAQVTGFKYGADAVTAAFGYSPQRLQLQTLSYTKPGQTLFSLSYGHTQGGGDNGQITSIADNVDGGRTVNYSYDALYRLKTAVTNGSPQYPQWGLSWTYDRYGNRTAQSVTAGTGPSNSVTIGATTNRIIGAPYAYDANGNMTNDGLNALAYDAENRVVTAAGATYSYDGAGLRVKKISGGNTTVYIFSGPQAIAEYLNGAAPSSPTREYVYSGAALIATHEAGSLKFQMSDHLSHRVTTDTSGNILASSGHYPFGEQWYNTSGGKWLFTTYERDSESGNDYAIFRFHVNRLGRFGAPDPLAGSIGDPQSLNRYAYVLNDVVNAVDPLGLQRRKIEPFMESGFGICIVDGIAQSCGLVSTGATVQCPNNNCAGIKAQVGPAGTVEFYRLTRTRELVLECRGASLSSHRCQWTNWSQQFVENGDLTLFVEGNRRWLDRPLPASAHAIAGQVYRATGSLENGEAIVAFYGISGAAAAAAVVGPEALAAASANLRADGPQRVLVREWAGVWFAMGSIYNSAGRPCTDVTRSRSAITSTFICANRSGARNQSPAEPTVVEAVVGRHGADRTSISTGADSGRSGKGRTLPRGSAERNRILEGRAMAKEALGHGLAQLMSFPKRWGYSAKGS